MYRTCKIFAISALYFIKVHQLHQLKFLENIETVLIETHPSNLLGIQWERK